MSCQRCISRFTSFSVSISGEIKGFSDVNMSINRLLLASVGLSKSLVIDKGEEIGNKSFGDWESKERKKNLLGTCARELLYV